jgi:hypothetical protein
MIELTDDGLTRLTYSDLKGISFKHIYSELNQDKTAFSSVQDSQTILSGLTEWVSDTTPVLSIGWDWKFDPFKTPPDYKLDGKPYSNIMLISETERVDIGKSATLEILICYISKLSWPDSVKTYLNGKYA